MIALGATIHEFVGDNQFSPSETRGWSDQSDHDEVERDAPTACA
jgi:hypothetical protein